MIKRWLLKLEDNLFWWLDTRWRARASLEQIKVHREWLGLDIRIKEREQNDSS